MQQFKAWNFLETFETDLLEDSFDDDFVENVELENKEGETDQVFKVISGRVGREAHQVLEPGVFLLNYFFLLVFVQVFYVKVYFCKHLKEAFLLI